MKIIVIFAILSLINVTFSTIRSLVTINGGKTMAAIINAAYFAYYNIVLIYTVADFPLWVKCVVTFGANLIGVFVVKYIEEKRKPERLWKLEMAIPKNWDADFVKSDLKMLYDIESNYVPVGDYTMFNCYCFTKEQTKAVKAMALRMDGKVSAYVSAAL